MNLNCNSNRHAMLKANKRDLRPRFGAGTTSTETKMSSVYTLASWILYVTVQCAGSTPASPLLQKEIKMIFCIFYVLNFFCFFFIFYRTCAERAQEHTRTHTALTAGVEGEETLGRAFIYTRGRVTATDQSCSSIFVKQVNKGA